MQRLRWNAGFLATRVARRTLFNFLSAALLPVLLSSLLGVWFVRKSLTDEAGERVDRTADAASLIVLRQLNTIEGRQGSDSADTFTTPTVDSLTTTERQKLASGGTVLRLKHAADEVGKPASVPVLMLKQTADGSIRTRRVNSEDLWAPLDELVDGDRADLCVFSTVPLQILHCTETIADADRETLLRIAGDSTTVQRSASAVVANAAFQERATTAANLIASSRELYLRYEFAADGWRVIAVENRATALAPASTAVTSLLLLIGLATVSAFAFAHAQIRRSTQPLEALHDATQRIGEGNLHTFVSISSNDEYGQLGSAFNTMTSTLARQFTLLTAMDEVDAVVLSASELHAIAEIALNGLRKVDGVEAVAAALLNGMSESEMMCWSASRADDVPRSADAHLTAHERDRMFACPRQFVVASDIVADCESFSWIPALRESDRAVFPLLHDGVLMGAVGVSLPRDVTVADRLMADVRRIGDRLALGIANVRMLDQLNALSSGTLLAFARAIDANSPWTAGHSERVTQLSIALGKKLGLSANDLATIYRGGLMHDVGKIGIAPAVLDKAGRLTDEERALIEKHPEIGERILRPIPGFADALPIVRSHHERFNGTGYPDRLVGENIPWLARIVAVADVYDALASDRPYRAGLSQRATITIIEGESGKHFDPRVVDALLALDRENSAALMHQAFLRELPARVGVARETPHPVPAVIS